MTASWSPGTHRRTSCAKSWASSLMVPLIGLRAKSPRYGSPALSNNTLSGITRPWTIPCSAAAISAPPTRLTSVATSALVSGPRSRRSARFPPGSRRIDQIGGARLAPVVVDRHDRRVPQRGHPMGAGLERAHELGAVGDLGADDPDGELALQPREPGRVHGAVATGAEPFAEAVPAQRLPGRRWRASAPGRG